MHKRPQVRVRRVDSELDRLTAALAELRVR